MRKKTFTDPPRSLNVKLSVEQHRQLRLRAAANDRSLSEEVRDIIEASIQEDQYTVSKQSNTAEKEPTFTDDNVMTDEEADWLKQAVLDMGGNVIECSRIDENNVRLTNEVTDETFDVELTPQTTNQEPDQVTDQEEDEEQPPWYG